MGKKVFSFLIITLLLLSVLSAAYVARPTSAHNSILGEGLDGKNRESSSMAPSSRSDSTGLSQSNDFAYVDGNKTRLVVGVDGEKSARVCELEKAGARHQARVVSTVSMGGKSRALIFELLLTSVTGFVEELRATDLASYIEPNMKVQAQIVPNDPYWSMQWGPQKIEADWAWNTTMGDPSILVAVVDTGVYYTHPDIAANYAALGRDWVNNDTDPVDDNGHGTHCAGIIAGVLNNNEGIAGLAQVRVMAEKVLDSGGYGYDDWVANGIIHATDSGADIISMSLGGYGDSQLIHDAVKYAYNAGVLVIAAAGNDNTNLKLYPAGYDEVIAVAATDQNDNKASFSNWGDWIELAAPGVGIYSTVPFGYEHKSGTSMACPHVAGVAALTLSQYPNRTGDWVRMWLRYTADDLGSSGFDVYFGYGRVNARKTVETPPPAHELIAYDLATPPYLKPGISATVNATVLNFGEDETDLTVQLLANDTVVGSSMIPFLSGGNRVAISLAWNPPVEGLYNITFYILPAAGETSLENNALWRLVYAGFPVKAAVLHSAGNIYSDIITNWQTLTAEWYLFGDTMVYIDYTSLNKNDITYDDIAATEADVLIISNAYDPWAGWQFIDSEVEAIARYVHEGHGLIATSGTFSYSVPNNNKLAPLCGLNDTTMWSTTSTNLMQLLNTTHPVFVDVPDPLVFPGVTTALPSDGQWDSDELVSGTYLAIGHYKESAIATRRGLVYISPILEMIPPYYHHHLQLLYNAIRWSRYERPQHGLDVSMQCPVHLSPGENVTVNATVTNIGSSDETNMELLLFSNGSQVASLTVPTLLSSESATLSYPWTPAMGTYNLTAYAPPLPGEDETFDNVKTTYVKVSYATVIGFVETHGESLHSDDLKTYYEQMGHIVVTIRSTLTPELLADYDIIIVGEDWNNQQWASSEIEAIQEFIRSGKGFVGVGDELAYPVTQILREYGIEYTGIYGDSGRSNNFDHSHPLMTGVNYIYSDYPVNSLRAASPGYWIANDGSNRHMLIAGEESGGLVLCMSDDFAGSAGQLYAEDNRIMFANMVDWMSVKYDHDLLVSLGAPAFLEPDNLVSLNATVRNRGLNNETDVELQLLLNGTVVDNITIPELATRQAYTLSYSWTPTVEGVYNVTAYVQPVPGEANTANNFASKSVNVGPIKHILFDQTHGTDYIGSYSTWVSALTERGYVVEANYATPVTPITLEGYDVVIIPQAYSPYSEDELETIQNFVFSGGGLLVIGDDNPYIYTDLTGFAGITWTSGGLSGTTTDITPHPVTEGVSSVYLYAPAALMDVSGGAQGLVRDSMSNVMLAVSEQSGKVLGFADEDSLMKYGITQADNLRLANNMIDWLSTTVPDQHDLAVSLQAPAILEAGTLLNATVRNRGLDNETNVELQLLINSTQVSSVLVPELPVGGFYTLRYMFPSNWGGKYNVTAYAPPVQGENRTLNNFVTRIVTVPFYVRTYSSPQWVGGGTPMDWHDDDHSWNYGLPFNFPFYGVYYQEIYISSNGLITFNDPDSSWSNSIPDLAGKLAIAPAWDDWETFDPYDIYIWQNSTHVGIRWCVDHHENQATVANFEVILRADGVIQFDYEYNSQSVSATVGISDGNGDILAEDFVDLNYIHTVFFTLPGPEPGGNHDIAVTNVDVSPIEVYQGWIVRANVTVANLGNVTETFIVSLYYDNSLIIAQFVINLQPNATSDLSFSWDTTHVGVGQNYTMKAVAGIVPGETNIVNNVLVDGSVEVRIVGDINGDGTVDILDCVSAARAFGATPSDPEWNMFCDVNQDGIVDIFDMLRIAKHFGESY